MKTIDAIESRTSVRDFSNKTIKFDAILEAIDAANKAPFAGNVNNLKFLIIEDKENKNMISEFTQQYWINESQWIILVCSEIKHLESLYHDKAEMYSRQQAGAAIQNMLLSITDQGLGACWVGLFSEPEIKSKLKIPDEWRIEAIVPIGYASKAKKKQKTSKADVENKIFWEKWNEKKKPYKYPYKDPRTS